MDNKIGKWLTPDKKQYIYILDIEEFERSVAVNGFMVKRGYNSIRKIYYIIYSYKTINSLWEEDEINKKRSLQKSLIKWILYGRN